MKKTLLILILLATVLSVSAQVTEIQYLSGKDNSHTVKWDFFCTGGMNSNKWSTIEVPSQWEQQGFGAYNYGQDKKFNDEKGLYKYQFTVPEKWKSKKVYIVFEGSMTDTEVKINGKSAGAMHQGSFYRFRYDITDLLEYGKQNLLEVTVSKESANASVNRAERRGDYWIFGGIYRPVYLAAYPEEFIDRVAIDAKADGAFNMDVFLNGKGKANQVVAQLQTLDGKAFGAPITMALTSDLDQVKLTGMFKNQALWTPETPNLYQVVVSLKNGTQTIHAINQRFGFRTVEVRKNDGIYVNNKKIMFRGVCRHTFNPETGRTISKNISIENVNLIKDMNMNAVRMSHYPPDTHFLDVCDSLGLFVLDELSGWHGYYDTETGTRIVKQMVQRDVNHPCVVLWDNGNEGGFNKDLRNEYDKWDPQNRQVIEPWATLNGMNTKHYPSYSYVQNVLNKGADIYFPTEFLHGLFDGGHGASLDDYWELMYSKPLSAGGFLWVFADEGIVRKDKNDSIDTHGNFAPDGILGPHHEKEGSFYTIKEIWSPVHFKNTQLNAAFDGKLAVNNRFLYTNLNKCKFSYELEKFTGTFPKITNQNLKGVISSPNIAPGDSGVLKINLPASWKGYDVMFITAVDPFGRQINRWSWSITQPQVMASRIVKTTPGKVAMQEEGDFVILSSGKVSAKFNKTNGLLTEVKRGNQVIPFNNGPLFVGDTVSFKELKHYPSGNNYVVEINYNKSPECFIKWTMLPGGWLQLEYQLHPTGKVESAGITFSYPEKLVTGATLMANGPYHVWKNRLKGTTLNVYNKMYNNTITGETWVYPEFKGYYANLYAVQVQTRELPFTIVSASSDLFLHLFTPQNPTYAKGSVTPAFPSGNISILNCIPPIGTKFSKPEDEGPAGQKNQYTNSDSPLKGKVYFRFGE
ncbi:MAG: glycoside hydrolase family 2 TIM barrel-domain containing protein [Bacteroidota bacterium]|nr:glycoside hydrolase family 2 TIM barrel-domain containing protein [Bacteroidota bacterium]